MINKKLFNESCKKFPSIICNLENFDCEITDKRILEELEYKQFIIECDGWECHLENHQKKQSLKSLIKKYKTLLRD